MISAEEATLLTRKSEFMDYDHELVIQFVEAHSNPKATKLDNAIQLYYAVRDEIRYDPYTYGLDRVDFYASSVITAKRAWCVPKAILYAACCRMIGIPSQLGFADVRNHLSTERMRKTMKTDIFHWHGYASIYLNDKWVKATPAFNIELCEKFRLKPLDFDGVNDSLYHAFDQAGNQHMEYLSDYGVFDHFPFDRMVSELKVLYSTSGIHEADFDKDVEKEIRTIQSN